MFTVINNIPMKSKVLFTLLCLLPVFVMSQKYYYPEYYNPVEKKSIGQFCPKIPHLHVELDETQTIYEISISDSETADPIPIDLELKMINIATKEVVAYAVIKNMDRTKPVSIRISKENKGPVVRVYIYTKEPYLGVIKTMVFE